MVIDLGKDTLVDKLHLVSNHGSGRCCPVSHKIIISRHPFSTDIRIDLDTVRGPICRGRRNGQIRERN